MNTAAFDAPKYFQKSSLMRISPYACDMQKTRDGREILQGTLTCPTDDPAYFKPVCDANGCDDEFECISTGTLLYAGTARQLLTETSISSSHFL